MARLAVALREFLQQKLLYDLDWQHVQVNPAESKEHIIWLERYDIRKHREFNYVASWGARGLHS